MTLPQPKPRGIGRLFARIFAWLALVVVVLVGVLAAVVLTFDWNRAKPWVNDKVSEAIGRPFAIEGVVEKGQQLGRKLGFPTANVPLGEYVAPKFGVYATRTRLKDGRQLPGVANIGVNPTTGLVEPRLEVWIFDFDEDIYGEVIESELLAFLRPELTFTDDQGRFDVPAMVRQIHLDAAEARKILRA